MVQAGLAMWNPVTTSWSVHRTNEFLSLILLLATWRLCRHMLWWLVLRAAIKWSEFCRVRRSVVLSFNTCILLLFVIYILLWVTSPNAALLKNTQLKHIFLYHLNIFALSCFVCLLRLNLVKAASIKHSTCFCLIRERTSSSKTLPSVCKRFQQEPPLNSSWERNTWLPWPHSECAATLLQVRTTEGLI